MYVSTGRTTRPILITITRVVTSASNVFTQTYRQNPGGVTTKS